jgi:hypothetical protein
MPTRAKWIRGFLAALLLVAIGGVAYAGNGTQGERFTADLSGAQEIPPADPDGFGKADLRIDVDGGRVCFDLKFHDVGTPNRAHIHAGDDQTNGPIVIPFFELRPGDATPTDPRHEAVEGGKIEDCVSASPELLADITARPDQYYVNIHNSRFPGGAARCQIEP